MNFARNIAFATFLSLSSISSAVQAKIDNICPSETITATKKVKKKLEATLTAKISEIKKENNANIKIVYLKNPSEYSRISLEEILKEMLKQCGNSENEIYIIYSKETDSNWTKVVVWSSNDLSKKFTESVTRKIASNSNNWCDTFNNSCQINNILDEIDKILKENPNNSWNIKIKQILWWVIILILVIWWIIFINKWRKNRWRKSKLQDDYQSFDDNWWSTSDIDE